MARVTAPTSKRVAAGSQASAAPPVPPSRRYGRHHLQAEAQRVSCCLDADKLLVHDKVLRNSDALLTSAPSFEGATGVAVVHLNISRTGSALEAMLSLVVSVGPSLRTIVLHIVNSSDIALSLHALEQVDQAIKGLHSLGVPIVRSTHAWSIASQSAVCCVPRRDRATYPQDRALQFAVWLSQHSGSGLKQMLHLTRQMPVPRLHNAFSTHTAAWTVLPYGAGTRTEMRPLWAKPSAQHSSRRRAPSW